jgi:EAL domain-containing protein (putative c-di-GMP-specific phosphodiesterase class I)
VLVTLADARAFNQLLRALGHTASETFVREGAARLAAVLPPGTAVYHVSVLSLAFRLPPGSTDPVALAERIARDFTAPVSCEGIPVDTRIGIGLRPLAGGCGPEDLRAALAAAQDSRRRAEGWAWYDARSDAAERRAFALLTDFKSALEAPDQLSLHFQPKVCLASGRCTGAEALVRWTHPAFGSVPSGEFVPLVEATALVTPLTRWIVSAAVRQVSLWRRTGLDLPLAVNVSPKNLEEPDFVEFLAFCCAASGVPRGSIELEITEGVSAGDGRLVPARLAALRSLGFGIAVDDFGSGYSNMAYLTRLSAGTLKLDRSLVRAMAEGEMPCRLVAGILRMARDLGYRTVAEGIETPADRDRLAAMGCDIGQGWLWSKPLPAADFLAWLDATRAAEARQRRG